MNVIEKSPETAIDFIRVLSEEIGPRPAGSTSEKQAMDYIQQKMEQFGYQVQRTEAEFASEWAYFPLFGIGAMLLIVVGLILPVTPIPALLLPFVYIALPQISRWLILQKPLDGKSENLFACNPQADQINRLIICAHVDSGEMSGLKQPALLKFYNQLLFYGQRIAIFLAMLAVVQMIGLTLPEEIYLAVKILVIFLGSIWFMLDLIDQIGGAGTYSAGANDNASGVAAAMEFARDVMSKSTRKFQVAFLFTGAEETGLHGAAAFSALLNPETDVVLNLDMVGKGEQLVFVTADGTLKRLVTDKHLNKIVQKADKNAKGIWYTVRSADFAAFLRNGIRASSVEMRSGHQTGYFYHSQFDHLQIIDENTLNAMNRFLKFFIAFYEDEF
jgi:hypothetical protein